MLVLAWPDGTVNLSWRHSVTRDWWREEWVVGAQGLVLEAAEVSGPGAGLEIPDDAQAIKGGWRYLPNIPPQSRLVLAASGQTSGGWQLCQDQSCVVLGQAAGEALVLERQHSCALHGDRAP